MVQGFEMLRLDVDLSKVFKWLIIYLFIYLSKEVIIIALYFNL